MSGPRRLPRGGLIDRSRPLSFTLDGRALQGFHGDTLASALLASGISVLGRSFKFHRPRGLLSAGIEEPNALLTCGTGAHREPNVRATVQPLHDGLIAGTQNCWPSVTFDIGRLNDVFRRLLPAGFYNKVFIGQYWRLAEPAIRHSAGLGIAPDARDPDRYEWRNAHCDVLVVGGGAAGMLAAYIAARTGARVILLESDRTLGGGLLWQRGAPLTPDMQGEAGANGSSLVDHAVRQLNALPTLRVLLNTTAVGLYDHGLVAANERVNAEGPPAPSSCRERWWRVRARHIVLACGAFEQPLAFPFNDRPGVMLADSVRHYLNRYAVAAGEQVSVVTNNDSAYQVALDLYAEKIRVPGVLDTRAQPPEDLIGLMSSVGIPVYRNASILRTDGSLRIHSLQFTEGADGTRKHRMDCDALAISGGWNPTAHLSAQAGARPRFEHHNACLVPGGDHSAILAVGAAAAQFDFNAAMTHTAEALAEALTSLGFAVQAHAPLWPEFPQRAPRSPTGALGYHAEAHRDRTWLDFQHDVTVSDIDLAVRENLFSVEHVKRYTTVGMSIDQGKTSNLNAIAVLADRSRRSIPEIGTTTFRPMFAPVTLGAIAGGRTGSWYRPVRRLPAHREHESLGAHFEDYGGWQRPAFYPGKRETPETAIQREVRAIRTRVGLYDGSALGKFLVRGPDAALFLDRIYATPMETLQPGKARYGIMLNERGIVIDDGVCVRDAAEEFWINTTSSGASLVSRWLDEWLQCEWPDLSVALTDVTSNWATLTLTGPNARRVLSSLPLDIDLDANAFPHMSARSGTLCGVPCRIARVSYTGELSYEISVPADYGPALWKRLFDAGRAHGLEPFGVESLLLARTEKGYLHVGADTDGTTVPDDIGLGSAAMRKSCDFVGRRSLTLPENRRADRHQLIGLRCTGNADAFVAGAHLVDDNGTSSPEASSGYLTSAAFSATLGMHVGLGLLKNGRARLGKVVRIMDGKKWSKAEVVNPTHYDSSGARLRG